ncbi:ATP-binding cassette domain-containing protein [Actinomyces sp. B33]|uniref:ATP-binding cassette domain-containing protein n=1 Tax=Actinomyces sp. B33 TaxID=2942131 RepID=UPI002340EAEB|nr:ATP-binding cassette domain-containing protein [Actinomyces sp. B33]MDC4233562.1 ATP-binding cassette domain-containing protein [Actinomyces sp. B33]
MPVPPTAVDIRDLTVIRGDVHALDGLDLTLDAGKVTLVCGGNGSGKSTLLLTLAGALRPESGTITGMPSEVALVPQRPPSADRLPLTVRAAVEMGRWPERGLLRRLRPEDHEAVDWAMSAVGILDLAGRQLSETSGGQCQRVLVAQALSRRTDMLLMDEPTAAADIESTEIIHRVAREKAADGAIVVIASHDPAARDYADEIVTLHAGRRA